MENDLIISPALALSIVIALDKNILDHRLF